MTKRDRLILFIAGAAFIGALLRFLPDAVDATITVLF
jgi:hypothetical protein